MCSPAAKITTIYLVTGLLWILFGDLLVASMISDPLSLSRWQSVKGSVFMLITGTMLYLLIRRSARRQQEAKEALAEERNLLRTLIDNLPYFIYTKDVSGRYILNNTTNLQLLKAADEQEVAGKTVRDLFPHAVAAQYEQDDMQVLLSGRALVEREEPFIDGEGNRRWYLTTKIPLKDRRGDVTGLVGISVDITDRKRMQEEKRKSEAMYHLIIENINEGIWTIDADSRTTFINRKMAEMLGYTVEQMQGKSVFDLINEEWRRIAEVHLERRRRGVREQHLFKFLRSDGTDLWVIMWTSPFLDEQGNYTGALATVTDLTERRELEEQLRQSQKMEAIGRLAGGVAHDFNNLLTAIIGYTELSLRQLDEHDRLSVYLNEVKRAGERAASLTKQLLAYSRKQLLQPKVLDLSHVVANMGKLLKRLIGEDIDLVTINRPGLWQVKADPGQIEQMLMNLVVNARDAMPDGGRLTLELENIELDEDQANLHLGVAPGHYVMLAVSDTGVGLDPATMAKIFDPFFTTKEPGKGTGLGLSTVYGIVKQSGGHILVYSEPGKGTTFQLYLPMLRETAGEEPEEEVSTEAPGGSETILIVEDETAVLGLATEALKGCGYNVLTADGPREALEIFERHQQTISLMLTDVVMPEMSGRELAELIERRHAGVRTRYMSGHTDDAIVRHGVLDPGVDFIQKPFDTVALARKVRDVLDKVYTES